MARACGARFAEVALGRPPKSCGALRSPFSVLRPWQREYYHAIWSGRGSNAGRSAPDSYENYGLATCWNRAFDGKRFMVR